MHDAAFSFYKQLFSRFLLLSAVFSTYKFRFFLSLCIICSLCIRSFGTNHRYQIKRNLIVRMTFYNPNLYVMLLKFCMSGHGLDKQTVSPVLIEVTVQNGSGALISIHDHFRHRSRLMNGLAILNGNSGCFNLEGNFISHIGSCKTAAEYIQKLFLLSGILLKAFQFRIAVVIFISYRILILIGSNRIRKCFPVKVRICLFGITILINFL